MTVGVLSFLSLRPSLAGPSSPVHSSLTAFLFIPLGNSAGVGFVFLIPFFYIPLNTDPASTFFYANSTKCGRLWDLLSYIIMYWGMRNHVLRTFIFVSHTRDEKKVKGEGKLSNSRWPLYFELDILASALSRNVFIRQKL